MSPLLEGIVAGVIANALTEVVGFGARKVADASSQRQRLEKALQSDTRLTPILQKAAVALAKSRDLHGVTAGDRLREFLGSPDVEAILRQIYAVKILKQQTIATLDDVYSEFLASLTLFLGPEGAPIVEQISRFIFDALLDGCEYALQTAIDQGVLSAHEARSASRHIVLMGELRAVERNVKMLTAPPGVDITECLRFERDYRSQVRERHSRVTPPNFDTARKFPIDDIYVAPSFITTTHTGEEARAAVDLKQMLSVLHRSIVLGKPGGGKSTLAQKLCFDLSDEARRAALAGRQVTPILVVLREYGSEKKQRKISILDFIELTANSSYQLAPPTKSFEYLLLNGRAFVIFDGLDELLDTSYRQTITADIESFCNLYPSVPVLVTSREVGYEQAPLDAKQFELLRLAEFDEAQVREYVRKWFSTDSDVSLDQQRRKTDRFMSESEVVADLRANPLMLGLMCNIYRGENYIPRNRPDVYEKCALMLFERWDKSRGINIPMALEAHVRPTMAYLAHWIYADERLQSGVTEERLVARAAEYLCPRRFEDPDEAAREARGFIEFCRGRAWVFTDTGTTADGEHLYQFTHRTFLEFFSAVHLIRTYPTPVQLAPVVGPKVSRGEWDVVAQLALQIQNKQVADAGDQLVNALIDQAQEESEQSRINLLSFVVRSTEFLIPSPRTIRRVVGSAFDCAIGWASRGKYSSQEGPRVSGPGPAPELIGNLFFAAHENRRVIEDTLERLIIDDFDGKDEEEKRAVAELALNLLSVTIQRRPQERVIGSEDASQRIANKMLQTYGPELMRLASTSAGVARSLFWRDLVGVRDIVGWSGAAGLFQSAALKMLPSAYWPSIAESIMLTIVNGLYDEGVDLGSVRIKLKEIGQLLPSCPLPWVSMDRPYFRYDRWEDFEAGRRRREVKHKGVKDKIVWDGDTMFGGLLIAAVFWEHREREGGGKALDRLKRGQQEFLLLTKEVLAARSGTLFTDAAERELATLGLSDAQRAFMWRWIRREVSLVDWREQ